MTIAKTVDLVVAAKEAGYAVPAVNIVDDLSLRAVVAAAEEAQSPVIIQTSVKTVKSIGAPLLSSIFSYAADAVSVPVSLHLDHCPDRSFITLAIENGWSSVLFDASDRPLEQAWQETREVVAEAHAKGVGVECEIENIVGVEDGARVVVDVFGVALGVFVVGETLVEKGATTSALRGLSEPPFLIRYAPPPISAAETANPATPAMTMLFVFPGPAAAATGTALFDLVRAAAPWATANSPWSMGWTPRPVAAPSVLARSGISAPAPAGVIISMSRPRPGSFVIASDTARAPAISCTGGVPGGSR